jgi:hypothetical protein
MNHSADSVLTAVKRGGAAPTAANSDTEITTIYSHNSTVPIPLPESLKRVLVQQFTADDLRHLAWLKDAESPGLMARRHLTDEGVEELVDIITRRNSFPTVGFFRRWTS